MRVRIQSVSLERDPPITKNKIALPLLVVKEKNEATISVIGYYIVVSDVSFTTTKNCSVGIIILGLLMPILDVVNIQS